MGGGGGGGAVLFFFSFFALAVNLDGLVLMQSFVLLFFYCLTQKKKKMLCQMRTGKKLHQKCLKHNLLVSESQKCTHKCMIPFTCPLSVWYIKICSIVQYFA